MTGWRRFRETPNVSDVARHQNRKKIYYGCQKFRNVCYLWGQPRNVPPGRSQTHSSSMFITWDAAPTTLFPKQAPTEGVLYVEIDRFRGKADSTLLPLWARSKCCSFKAGLGWDSVCSPQKSTRDCSGQVCGDDMEQTELGVPAQPPQLVIS